MATPITSESYFNADPTCREIEGRFWLFCTHDQTSRFFEGPQVGWGNMFSYQAYSTVDFTDWVHHGSILSCLDVAWATETAVWDGDAGIGANGKYYAYIPFEVKVDGVGEFQIGVLEADRPEGPYRDALGKPLVTESDLLAAGFDYPRHDCFPGGVRKGMRCLSPTVVYGDDDQPYLLFGQFAVYVVPLAPSMTGFAGEISKIELPYEAGDALEFIEGPMLHKVRGRWCFSYMAYKNWQGRENPHYRADDPEGPYIQVCYADQMTGPFGEPEHWIYPVAGDACNNQHALCKYQGEWVVAYHVPASSGSQHRQTVVTRLEVDDQGKWCPIYPGSDPELGDASRRTLTLAARAKRWAQEFFASEGVEMAMGPRQLHHACLGAGGWLAFRRMDFGEGVASVRLWRGPQDDQDRANGRLWVCLDTPSSEPVARADLSGPVVEVRLGEGIKGVHDVYFVAETSCSLLAFAFN